MTAGAWNGDLIDVLGGLAVPERQVLAWLQPSRPDLFRPDSFPVFNLLVDEGRFYGFPVFGVPGFIAPSAEGTSATATAKATAIRALFMIRPLPLGAVTESARGICRLFRLSCKKL